MCSKRKKREGGKMQNENSAHSLESECFVLNGDVCTPDGLEGTQWKEEGRKAESKVRHDF